MKPIWILVGGLCLAGCASNSGTKGRTAGGTTATSSTSTASNQSLIVGRWRDTTPDKYQDFSGLEFVGDGSTLIMYFGTGGQGRSQPGSYQMIDERRIKMTFPSGMSSIWTIESTSSDRLVMNDGRSRNNLRNLERIR